MELKQALRLNDHPRLALVGAGGKTTAMFRLAREFPPPVIVCASAHLSLDQVRLADRHRILSTLEDANTLQDAPLSGVTLLTGPVAGDRTTGLPLRILNWLYQYCGDYSLPLVIEADGSRQRPLKAPASHEPVIPGFVGTVVVVAGLSGLGQPLTDDLVHRPEIFASISGLEIGETITTEALSRVLRHPRGGLKGIPPKARRVALLNQADSPKLRELARGMIPQLFPGFQSVLITALNTDRVVFSAHEPVAGIVLAAGEAARFGQPKQVLPWQGKPLVWHVASKALEAGLSPVLVVTGAFHEAVNSALADLSVQVVHNPDWRDGQGTSVGAGVRALPSQSGAALFLLADQPKIPVPLIRELVQTHAQTLAPIVSPQVAGRRANPVLFDRALFGELSVLTGDAGGRQLFSAHPTTWVPWDDPKAFQDIDTPGDYERLPGV